MLSFSVKDISDLQNLTFKNRKESEFCLFSKVGTDVKL